MNSPSKAEDTTPTGEQVYKSYLEKSKRDPAKVLTWQRVTVFEDIREHGFKGIPVEDALLYWDSLSRAQTNQNLLLSSVAPDKGFNNTESSTFITIMMHIELQSDTWTEEGYDTLSNLFTPVDEFQTPEYIMQLRSVCNDTISYNQVHYGTDSHANSAFTTAEAYRYSGDYRRAASYYGIAYRYAVTP